MTRKSSKTKGLGNAIQAEKARQLVRMRAQAERMANLTGVGLASGASVLEQPSLDELIATIEVKKEIWADEVGEAEFVQGPTLVSYGSPHERLVAEKNAADRRELLSIPRRPIWKEGMSVEELKDLESEAFAEWRRGLTAAAETEGLYLTPYERNLDFWRQLWRCIERSDLLVQIVDGRDPDFYHCRDLARYVQEKGDGKKRLITVVNKADFLTVEMRAKWLKYFESRGLDVVFFAALREVKRQQREGAAQPRAHAAAHEAEVVDDSKWEPLVERRPVPTSTFALAAALDEAEEVDPATVPVPDTDDECFSDAETQADRAVHDTDEVSVEEQDTPSSEVDGEDAGEKANVSLDVEFAAVADSSTLLDEIMARLPEAGDDKRRGCIGFVGYPNVGKSTVINAIVGSKRVGMSRTPGKTKHIQTLELPDFGVTLCDCPGLVFPSVAATKAHLVINNTVHIDDLRECFAPIQLIIDKIGFANVLAKYDCASHVADARKRSGDHVLDDSHAFLAALATSRSHFLRVGVPDENWAARKVLKDYVSGTLLHCEEPPAIYDPNGIIKEGAEIEEDKVDEDRASDKEDDEDFGDLSSFLGEARNKNGKTMTKRRMRKMQKQMLKGKLTVESAGFVEVAQTACHGVWGVGATPPPRAS